MNPVGSGVPPATWLAAASVSVFAGRALQHFFGAPPYSSLFWDQGMLEPWVGRFLGMSWEDWASSPGVEAGMDGLTKGLGLLYAACALALLPAFRGTAGVNSMRRSLLIAAGCAGLLALALLQAKEKFWRAGEFVEYSSQWMAPLLLLLLAHARTEPFVAGLARLAVAGTFAGHGLYAVGIYPVPGSFLDMVILHFGVSEGAARLMLLWMGVLDFAVAAAMLLPARLARPFLAYAAAWGALTALARLAAGWDAGMPGFAALRWIPEVLIRAPHALLPLCVLALEWKNPAIATEDATPTGA